MRAQKAEWSSLGATAQAVPMMVPVDHRWPRRQRFLFILAAGALSWAVPILAIYFAIS
jgi:hypothetical protein